MSYAGIQMFMEKLNQLINCNDIPFVDNPAIIRERRQFQLLYDELGSMTQTLFIDQHQDPEKLNDLKKRFIDASEEAQYIVDLFLSRVPVRNNEDLLTSGKFKRSSKSVVVHQFLSRVHIRNSGHFLTCGFLKRSINLDGVRRSIKSVQVEFMSMNNDSKKMDSPPRPQKALNQSVAGQSSMSRNSLGSKKLLDEIFVGIDGDAELIRDKLVEDQKKLDVVSIVGMGGIGKTTLATKVFNDGYVKHHFYVRVWVTVSQTYDNRGVLTQILESIRGQLDLEKASDSRLRELVHKHLMGKRYLIVIDDIWHVETWDDLKLFFPHCNNGSRILLTSRITEVAKHANSYGLIHHLGYLNKEKCWELLCQKVFHGNKCPIWSIKPGMQIVESCQGLPLAVVVTAGVLAKEAWSEKLWVEIADRTGSCIVSDQNGCMETLALSYNHLPLHLRECFLYLGGFPEDFRFKVKELIWLWVAEGFIQQDGNRSLEDIAEGYLMDLIDRNLVIVADMSNSNGGVKACKVHDLVRELCMQKAEEERFVLQKERLILSPQFSNVITPSYMQGRMFINTYSYNLGFDHLPDRNLRSILCFYHFRDDITKYFRSFVLLRVLDLQKYRLGYVPHGMELLVHLRYLAIWCESNHFLSQICNLWSLQTLIYITKRGLSTNLPSNISDLVNLRHLRCYDYSTNSGFTSFTLFLHSIEKPMNLQTISHVELGDGVDNFQKCFPYIKELTCGYSENDFKPLTYLEKLKLTGIFVRRVDGITLPATLKSLALVDCRLPWSEMSIIQSLPNLQVLKLHKKAFEGSCWNTDGQEFQKLKFLRLAGLDIQVWEAYTTSFPCLKRLEIFRCKDLEEIPLEIGEIPTLELIQIKECWHSVDESVRRIQEEQHDYGNYDLRIDISETR